MPPATTRRSPLRAAATNLALLGGAVLAACAGLEVALRILPLRDPGMVTAFQNPPWEAWADSAWGNPGRQAYRAEPTIGYEHAPQIDEDVRLAARPNGSFHFRTNDLGVRRDTDTPARKPPGTRRVLILGDSHTDGYVDNAESFAALLEARLSARLGPTPPVEVLNAGVVGYSPAQEVLWYRVRGAALDPDVVVLVLYAGNDVAELADPSKPGVDPTTGRGLPAAETGAGAPGRFGPHDRLDAIRVVAWTRAAIRFGPLAPLWRRFDLPGAVHDIGDFRTETLSEVLRICHGCFWQSLQQAARAERHPARTREDIGTLAAIVGTLEREVRAHGERLVVAVLPTRGQVEPARAHDERARVATLLGLGEASFGFEDEVVRTLVSAFDTAGLTVVSLLPPLRDAAATGAQYYERDWHLAPPGHRTVAAALEDAVLGALAAPVVKTLQSDPAHARR